MPRASLSSAAEAQVSFVKILRILPEIHSNFVQYTPQDWAPVRETGRPSVYNTFENRDLAVGNIIGSNILNILWVLGLTGIILPLPFNADFEH